MKRMLLTSVKAGMLVLLCVSLAGVANAGSLDDARVTLRIGAPVAAAKVCLATNVGVDQDCATFSGVDPDNTSGLTTYYYLIVGQAATGVGGVSFGLDYSNVFVGWTPCHDGLDFTNNNFPASGGGNRATFTTCGPAPTGLQATTASGIQVAFGAFYIYKYGNGVFSIVKNPLSPGAEDDELAVGDCNAQTSSLSILAGSSITIGPGDGYQPCGEIATQPTTWGNVKSLYSKSE